MVDVRAGAGSLSETDRRVPAPTSDAWSRFWAGGAPHSCAGSFGTRYGGAIGRWWIDAFAALDDRFVVLDVGTGGGPLPRLLVERAAGGLDRMPLIHAVDLATVVFGWIPDPPPPWAARIVLHPNTAAESLPLPAASVDFVCSQFGIEYADPDRSIAEVLRVLKPTGRAAFVVHAADSVLAAVAADELAHIEWLVGEIDWINRVKAMLVPMALAATADGRDALRHDPVARAARDAFNSAMRALQLRAANSPIPDALLDASEVAMAIFRQSSTHGAEIASSALDAWAVALDDARIRQRGLISAAFDRVRLERFCSRFLEAGRSVDVKRLEHENGQTLAWGLQIAALANG